MGGWEVILFGGGKGDRQEGGVLFPCGFTVTVRNNLLRICDCSRKLQGISKHRLVNNT